MADEDKVKVTGQKEVSQDKESSGPRPTLNKTFWLVNSDGFPLTNSNWEKMWDYVIVTHPEGQAVAESIRGKINRRVPYPSVPVIQPSSSIPTSLIAVQEYIQKLQYNYTGMQFFDVKRYRPLSRLMDLAKEMIKESLPIKCLEAVILSLYLTSPLSSLQRFTIRFKSRYEGRCYRHVVLGLHQGGIYGALGLSRRLSLMYKPFHYKSLVDLIKDFISSYTECKHELLYIKLSSPVMHDTRSCEQIQWKFLVISLKDIDGPSSLKRILDRYCRAIRTL